MMARTSQIGLREFIVVSYHSAGHPAYASFATGATHSTINKQSRSAPLVITRSHHHPSSTYDLKVAFPIIILVSHAIHQLLSVTACWISAT